MRLTELDIFQNQLCLPRSSAQLTTSRLWCFTAPMHVAGQQKRGGPVEEKAKPRTEFAGDICATGGS